MNWTWILSNSLTNLIGSNLVEAQLDLSNLLGNQNQAVGHGTSNSSNSLESQQFSCIRVSNDNQPSLVLRFRKFG